MNTNKMKIKTLFKPIGSIHFLNHIPYPLAGIQADSVPSRHSRLPPPFRTKMICIVARLKSILHYPVLMNLMAKTLFQKIWDSHVVAEQPNSPAVLYIDLHLVHEVTSPQAFDGLRQRGLKVRRADKTLATIDHSIPTTPLYVPIADAMAAAQIKQMETNAAEFGITLHGMNSLHRGIVHVIGPELGRTQPGMTIVCGDSHTATHGAFGALAFGIGTSEVEHVLATQCLFQKKPKTYEVRVDGTLPKGVSAKDIILALIAKIGIGGGTGHVFEYSGSAIRGLTMEQRMTICNMSIEGGARAGMVAPDDNTFEYLARTRIFSQRKRLGCMPLRVGRNFQAMKARPMINPSRLMHPTWNR